MSVSRIAEKAGVSIATVSRVLNNSRPVNPELAEAVHRAMQELQLPARQVRRRSRSKNAERHATIAIVSLGDSYRGWFELPVMAGVVAELTRSAQDQQMGVLMAEMPDPRQISPILRRPEVDGAIVFVSSSISINEVAVLQGHIPIVRVMGGQLSPVTIDHIGADNNAIGYLAGEYLLKRGLRELAYLTTSPSWEICKLRAQGFLAVAQDAHILPTMYIQSDNHPSLGLFGPSVIVENELAQLIQRIKSNRNRPIGLFVSRDEETVNVYRLLREAGIEPGKDVIVVSCDNETVRLSTLHPRPASIDLVPTEIARHAIRRIATRIKFRDEEPVRILVNPRLVAGEGD